MARDLTFDFTRGGGSSTEFLWGDVTIVGTEQAANGTAWVVTSETTLKLVNGKATLPGALERPSDGSKGHLHVVVRDRLSPRGASFRKFVPAGASPVAFNSLPDAWRSVTSGTRYWWDATPNASVSYKTVDSVITRTNLAYDPATAGGLWRTETSAGGVYTVTLPTDAVGPPVPYYRRITCTTVPASWGRNSLIGDTAGPMRIPVTPGKTYCISSWVRASRTNVWYGVQFRTAAATTVSESAVTIPITSGQWTRVQHIFTVPANTAFIKMWVGGNTGWVVGHYIDVTATLIEESPTLEPYFDGNTK